MARARGLAFPELPIKPLTRDFTTARRSAQPGWHSIRVGNGEAVRSLAGSGGQHRDKPGTGLFKDQASTRTPASERACRLSHQAVRCFFMCMESEPPDDCDLAERQYSDRLRSHEKFCVTSLLGDTPSPITSGLMPSVVKAIVAAFFMRWPTYTPDGAFYTRRIPPWWFPTRQRHGVMRSWHMRGFAREVE